MSVVGMVPSAEAHVAEQFRRTDPRYARRLDVEILHGDAAYPAITRNISLGGMFVETMNPLPLSTKVQIRFQVPTQPEPVLVEGEVRWLENGQGENPMGMGIRFQGMRAREVWALNRFFQG
jgi:uncharacterized protein (TIGR02266 family)